MIVAGFGFRDNAPVAALRAALAAARVDRPQVDALATAHDKIATLARLGDELGVPVLGIPSAALRAIVTVTRSSVSLAVRGTGSVAEAAALAAAGPGARLIVLRQVSPDRQATCALAEGSAS